MTSQDISKLNMSLRDNIMYSDIKPISDDSNDGDDWTVQWDDLGFRQILGSDKVNPQVINENFNIINRRLSNDYVVAHINSAPWWARVWNSGFIDFGIQHYNYGYVYCGIKWTSVHYSSHRLNLPGNYPYAMASAPYLDIQIQEYNTNDSSGEAWMLYQVSMDHTRRSTTTPPAWCVYTATEQPQHLYDLHISVYGYGWLN